MNFILYFTLGLNPVYDSSEEFAPGDVIEIPLITLRNVVIFPHETLPLRLHIPRSAEYFISRNLRNNNGNLIGVITVLNSSIAAVGTCAVIKSFGYLEDFVMTVKGRNRFKILSSRNITDEVKVGRVEIVSEGIPKTSNPYYIDKYTSSLNPAPQWLYLRYCPYNLSREATKLFNSTRRLDDVR